MMDDAELVTEGRRVLEVEASSLHAIIGRLDDSFAAACRLVTDAPGRVIVSGIGKSGIIGRKIAATLTSTGTPATFLHPVEGLHGDLGIIGTDDVALLISKSGETSELAGLLDYLIRLGVPVVALTGDPTSSLARHAEVVLDCSVAEEACPMDLAPTSSTTVTLALGDALAVAILRLKEFSPEDFARFHPGGALGRKLTIRVGDVMVAEAYPALGTDADMRRALVPIAEQRGTVPIVDDLRRVVGVVTAGDLTRAIERFEERWVEVSVTEVMNRTPITARPDERGAAIVHRLEERGVMAAPVVDDEGRLVGMVHLHDLMRAGAV